MEYTDVVRDVLSDEKRREFIVSNLRMTMTGFCYSESLIREFLTNITTLDLPVFIQKHKEEFARIQLGYFFDELVPLYFNAYILPEVPKGGKVLDLGCGRGTLIQCLVNRGENDEIVGMDITDTPEWKTLEGKHVRFEVVQENNFLEYIKKEQPDHVTVTWVLHHMEYEQQKRYLETLFSVLKQGATVVVLEDAYSEIMPPEAGVESWEAFKQWDVDDRQKIMGAYDWIANRVLSMRVSTPVPFAYRSVEGWKEVFEEVGFTVKKTRFLGFPENRDVNTVQSVLVAVK